MEKQVKIGEAIDPSETEMKRILEDFEEETQTVDVSKEDLEDTKVEIKEEEPEQEVTLDDLDDVPESEKYRSVSAEDLKALPKTLTIANVKLGKVYKKDQDGNDNVPETNASGGKYFKSKLILELAEEINGDKVRIMLPSIFYSVDEDGNIGKIPTIPKACPDDKLDDKFTSEVAKTRNKQAKFWGKRAKDVSSADFVKGLVGMKFTPEIEQGEFKKKTWTKIKIGEFVK